MRNFTQHTEGEKNPRIDVVGMSELFEAFANWIGFIFLSFLTYQRYQSIGNLIFYKKHQNDFSPKLYSFWVIVKKSANGTPFWKVAILKISFLEYNWTYVFIKYLQLVPFTTVFFERINSIILTFRPTWAYA